MKFCNLEVEKWKPFFTQPHICVALKKIVKVWICLRGLHAPTRPRQKYISEPLMKYTWLIIFCPVSKQESLASNWV